MTEFTAIIRFLYKKQCQHTTIGTAYLEDKGAKKKKTRGVGRRFAHIVVLFLPVNHDSDWPY